MGSYKYFLSSNWVKAKSNLRTPTLDQNKSPNQTTEGKWLFELKTMGLHQVHKIAAF